MNTKIKCLFAFAFGASVGVAATWKFWKTKYEQLAQEEIDSVKEAFSKREEKIEEKDEARPRFIAATPREIADEAKDKPSVIEYAAKLQEMGYSDESEENVEEEEEEEIMDVPRVIPPEEFGEKDDYECITLIYYTDGVLADEEDEPVEDVDDVVGLYSLKTFGEYEDDAVHVRNDRLKCYYEILQDRRKFSTVINKKPHQLED